MDFCFGFPKTEKGFYIMEDVCYVFSKRLKDRRRELGMTQKELADLISYSEKAVSKWERGNALPPSCILPDISRILNTSIDELMLQSEDIRYFLGVDGGGTKTAFLLVDSDGATVKSEILGPSNPNDVGFSATEEILYRGISAVCEGYNPRMISAFVGLAGAKSADNMERLHKFLSRFNFGRVGVDSDMETAAAAGLGSSDGIAVICGTGSVVYVKRGEERIRIGGYGYLLGDPASGFNFGRDAILAALCEEDGSGEPTAITPIIKEKLGRENMLSALSIFYKGGKREIAKYAHSVFDAASLGDAVAIRILDENITSLSRMIRAAADKFDTSRVKIAFVGGIAEKNPEFINLIADKLRFEKKKYEISLSDREPIHGAIYLAKDKEKRND